MAKATPIPRSPLPAPPPEPKTVPDVGIYFPPEKPARVSTPALVPASMSIGVGPPPRKRHRSTASPEYLAASALGPGEWLIWNSPRSKPANTVRKWRLMSGLPLTTFIDDKGRRIVMRLTEQPAKSADPSGP